MKTYTIHHFITPLLTKGHVDGELEPDLFEAMMKRLSDIKDALYPLGATVKTSTMRKGIMLDAIPEEMLDEIAEKEGSHPIVAAVQQNTRDYKDSVAITFFRRCLNQEEDLGGEQIWQPESEVETAVRQAYARVYDRDEYGQNIRINRNLSRLENDGLIEKRTIRGKTEWRGTKWLAISIDQNSLRDFEAMQQEVLRSSETEDDGKRTEALESPVDTIV